MQLCLYSVSLLNKEMSSGTLLRYSGKNHLVISLSVSGFIFTFKSSKIIVYV